VWVAPEAKNGWLPQTVYIGIRIQITDADIREKKMNWMEVLSSATTFAGASLLAVDALRARSNTKVKRGARKLEQRINDLLKQQIIAQAQKADQESVTEQLDRSLAERTRLLTVWGYGVLTIGFLLDLAVKLNLKLS